MADPITGQAGNIQLVYERSLLLACFVFFVVGSFLITVIRGGITNSTVLERPVLELFWGSFPILLLLFLCGISIRCLYVNDETNEDPFTEVQVVGHQWY